MPFITEKSINKFQNIIRVIEVNIGWNKWWWEKQQQPVISGPILPICEGKLLEPIKFVPNLQGDKKVSKMWFGYHMSTFK